MAIIREPLLLAVTLVCYTAIFRVVTQRSSPPLRDDTKNGCVADYRSLDFSKIQFDQYYK